MRRVGFWLRLAATLIDAVILYPVLLAAFGLLLMSGARPREAEQTATMIWFLAIFLYSTCEFVFAGTLGKRIVGILIARADGLPADRWRRVFRWSTKQFWLIFALLYVFTAPSPISRMAYLVSGFSSLFFIVGCLYAMNDSKQAWHDEWTSTAVFRRRDVQATIAATPVEAANAAGERDRL